MTFVNLSDLTARTVVPGFDGKFVHGEQMTVSYFEIEAGATLPEHTHPHEQITSVIKGQLELTIAGETRVLEPGTALVIPGNMPHGGRALAACYVIDVFCPVREDYR